MQEKLYAERDPEALDEAGGHYMRHLAAMTAEGLHHKAEIAAELAFRDLEIETLKSEIEKLRTGSPAPVRHPEDPWAQVELFRWQHGELSRPTDERKLDPAAALEAVAKAVEAAVETRDMSKMPTPLEHHDPARPMASRRCKRSTTSSGPTGTLSKVTASQFVVGWENAVEPVTP